MAVEARIGTRKRRREISTCVMKANVWKLPSSLRAIKRYVATIAVRLRRQRLEQKMPSAA